MIKINIKSKENAIFSIDILGHSGYDDYGKDIVCASVSSIVITTVNAILRLENSIKYEQYSGNVKIEILKHDNNTDTLIDNMIDLLEKLEKQYKKNIKINKEVFPC